jgi:hypothetical protein
MIWLRPKTPQPKKKPNKQTLIGLLKRTRKAAQPLWSRGFFFECGMLAITCRLQSWRRTDLKFIQNIGIYDRAVIAPHPDLEKPL